MIYILAGGVAVAFLAFYFVPPVNRMFRDSEVMLLSWIAAVAPAIDIAAGLDPSLVTPILPEKWQPFYPLFMAVAFNIARRVRAGGE